MLALRERIIAAFFARLQTVPGVSIALRMPGAQPSSLPALALDDRGQQVLEQDATTTRYIMVLAVEGFVKGSGGAAAHTALNALYLDTVKAVLADVTFGGLATDCREGDLSVDVAALASEASLSFALIFNIEFQNRSVDPALA